MLSKHSNQWLNGVGHECHVGIGLEVHEMEIQFWETLTPGEVLQPDTLPEIYARLIHRLVQRSTYGVPPEGMPTRFANLEVECERRGIEVSGP
jgi:hypothetical protein